MNKISQKAKALRKQDYHKHNDSCLAKVGEDEPIFVLRARDICASFALAYWITAAELSGCVPEDKIDGAKVVLKQFAKFPGRRFPD